MKLEIDPERCTGHGRCFALVPSLFDSDEYGHGVVIAQGPIDPALARIAVENCPERAVTFEP